MAQTTTLLGSGTFIVTDPGVGNIYYVRSAVMDTTGIDTVSLILFPVAGTPSNPSTIYNFTEILAPDGNWYFGDESGTPLNYTGGPIGGSGVGPNATGWIPGYSFGPSGNMPPLGSIRVGVTNQNPNTGAVANAVGNPYPVSFTWILHGLSSNETGPSGVAPTLLDGPRTVVLSGPSSVPSFSVPAGITRIATTGQVIAGGQRVDTYWQSIGPDGNWYDISGKASGILPARMAATEAFSLTQNAYAEGLPGPTLALRCTAPAYPQTIKYWVYGLGQ